MWTSKKKPWILLDPVDSKMFGQLTIAGCFFAMKDWFIPNWSKFSSGMKVSVGIGMCFLKETPVLLGSTSLVSLQPPRWAAHMGGRLCAQADHCLSAADHLIFVISRVGFLVSSMPMSYNWNTLRQAAFEPKSFMSKAFTTEDFCTRSSLHRRSFAPETLVHHKQKPFTPERFDTNIFFSKQRLTPEDFCTTSLLLQKPLCKTQLENAHAAQTWRGPTPPAQQCDEVRIHRSSTTMWC